MLVLLFFLWFIFNGKITLEIAVFGVAITVVIYAFMVKFMDYSWKKEITAYRLVPLGLKYLLVLIWEIIKANAVVLRLVTSDRYELQPAVVQITPELKSETARVILANSITLTPGTYTVGISDTGLRVHCLDRDFSEDMENSVFVKQLRKMEGLIYETGSKKEAEK